MIYFQLAFAFASCPLALILIIRYEIRNGLIEVPEKEPEPFERVIEVPQFEIVNYNHDAILKKAKACKPVKIELEINEIKRAKS